ncbi:MAG: hypothetical protein JXQ23_10830 [Clostridia bacterium]|nr:hypothetical protein [Clostridia bacterium]
MNHKLIIIDGQSTAGKSTISKSVSEQLSLLDNVYWLHEECFEHPIRHDEFKAGCIHTLEGMEINKKVMLDKWSAFYDDIVLKNQVCITEGCFLHSIDRYLLDSIWNEQQIKDYFDQIMEILTPLHPLIIFLKRSDIEKSFKRAFKDRGDWWRDLILSIPEPYGYFETHDYTGDESIFDSIRYSQDQMEKIFDDLLCTKLKIDTSNDLWDSYVKQITEYAGYHYLKTDKTVADIEKYCGTYKLLDGSNRWVISYDHEKKQFYTSLFWPYMAMTYTGEDCLELSSFPAKLKFELINEKLCFTVHGNYDWNYNNKMFVKL